MIGETEDPINKKTKKISRKLPISEKKRVPFALRNQGLEKKQQSLQLTTTLKRPRVKRVNNFFNQDIVSKPVEETLKMNKPRVDAEESSSQFTMNSNQELSALDCFDDLGGDKKAIKKPGKFKVRPLIRRSTQKSVSDNSSIIRENKEQAQANLHQKNEIRISKKKNYMTIHRPRRTKEYEEKRNLMQHIQELEKLKILELEEEEEYYSPLT